MATVVETEAAVDLAFVLAVEVVGASVIVVTGPVIKEESVVATIVVRG